MTDRLPVHGLSPQGGSAGQAVVVSSDGQRLEFGTAAAGGGGGSGGDVLLSEASLPAATNTITFGSGVVPAIGYRDLRIELFGRSNRAAANETADLALNGDTAVTKYRLQLAGATVSTSRASSVVGATGARGVAVLPGASAAAGLFGFTTITLADYLDTSRHQSVLIRTFEPGGPLYDQRAIQWGDNAAIISVDLSLAIGQFVAGTVARLYGVADGTAAAGVGGIDGGTWDSTYTDFIDGGSL